MKLKTLDLFSGAGGLSLGFIQTGCFDIKVAVECDHYAAKTYEANHEGVVLLQEDASKISFKEKIGDRFGEIDVVIGGPPCQGFSNANRQKANLISGNNQLVQHYVRAIEELHPKIFVLENVKTLESKKHFFFVTHANKNEIQRLNMRIKKEKILLCGGGEVVEVIARLVDDINNISKYRMSDIGYGALCTLLKNSRTRESSRSYITKKFKRVQNLLDSWFVHHYEFWSSEWQNFYDCSKSSIERFILNDLDYSAYYKRLKMLVEIERTIERVHELQTNDVSFEIKRLDNNIVAYVDTFTVADYLKHKFKELGYETKKAILNAADFGVPQTRERFIMIGINKEFVGTDEVKLPSPIIPAADYYTVRDAIEDLEQLIPAVNIDAEEVPAMKNGRSRLAVLLGDSNKISNHIMTETREIAQQRFKALGQGENFHSLDCSLKTTYSLPERTQNTIYLRLKYDQPSGTVMNVRKSMWIHPTLDRALSIREAARLQSFPDSFVFYGSKNSRYQQVGNAVPPLLGRAIAETILKQLGIVPINSLADDIGYTMEPNNHLVSSQLALALREKFV